MRATGRNQAEWYSLLDAWGAPGRPFKELSAWLTGEHGVSKWWAQKLIVEYEQERGIRAPGVRQNGTFEVSASKTVAVSATRLFDAFVDPRQRRRWLDGGSLRLRTSDKPRSARFAWHEAQSRVTVTVTRKDRSKAAVTVAHDRLHDSDEARSMKTFWRERLSELKELLEA
jgi:uncharacterized protein YndB with AHSA1/START domain